MYIHKDTCRINFIENFINNSQVSTKSKDEGNKSNRINICSRLFQGNTSQNTEKHPLNTFRIQHED